jgi:hypothetical protein
MMSSVRARHSCALVCSSPAIASVVSPGVRVCSHDQQLNFWVSLALLIQHRSAILNENIVMLPESLSKLTISTKKEASILVNRAKKLYRSQASATCRAQLHDFTSRKISMDSVDYHKLLHQGVLVVSEEELVRACYGDIKLSGSSEAAGAVSSSAAASTPIKFFILDCRPLEQYEAGHLPCAYHLDPELVSFGTQQLHGNGKQRCFQSSEVRLLMCSCFLCFFCCVPVATSCRPH